MAPELRDDSPEKLAGIRANELLIKAEDMFGPMTSCWRFTGVLFSDCPPHLEYTHENYSVQIVLSMRAIDDDFQRDFQLAHEICHLLYPSVELDSRICPPTTILNEGISTYFSIVIVALDHGEEAAKMAIQSLNEYSPKYFNAFQLTASMLQVDKDSVKKLRAIQPMVNKINSEDFKNAGVILSDEQRMVLTAVF